MKEIRKLLKYLGVFFMERRHGQWYLAEFDLVSVVDVYM